MTIEMILFFVSLLTYVASFLVYAFSIASGKTSIYFLARRFYFLGASLATVALILRWQESGHPPLSNMYESLVTLSTFLAWSTLIFTFSSSIPLVEGATAVLAVLMIGVASVFPQNSTPLVPALQSYWLHIHVSVSFLGEACFALSFALGYLYCIRRLLESDLESSANAGKEFMPSFPGEVSLCNGTVLGLPALFFCGMAALTFKLYNSAPDESQWRNLAFFVVTPLGVFTAGLFLAFFLYRKKLALMVDRLLPPAENLDELIYRAIALGYPLFTVGAIIFGMVWAYKAWGRYWGWDPKETWALITFLVYSWYLHLRYSKGWKGTGLAVLAVMGFLVTMFTLFGVNLILSGLHSYATN